MNIFCNPALYSCEGIKIRLQIIFFSPLFFFLTFLSLLSAGAEGDITWQKDGEDIDDEEIVNKLDEASSKLVIKKAIMQDAGRYTCHCDFDSGHKDDAQIQLFVYGT